MSIKELKEIFSQYPDDFQVELWSDQEIDGIEIVNPHLEDVRRVSETVKVIEIP